MVSLAELVPNSLINGSFGPQWIEPKNRLINCRELTGIPVAGLTEEVVGVGDWGHGRSENGSVVLRAGSGFVVKAPMGKVREGREPMAWAGEMNKNIKKNEGISPKTWVILARKQNGEVVPVIIQREILGQPICETKMGKILQVEVLEDLLKICLIAQERYEETGVIDLGGQEAKYPWYAKLCKLIILFSDNIMIEGNKAWLADNTPDETTHMQATLKGKVAKRLLFIINTLGIRTTLGVIRGVNKFQSWFGKRKAPRESFPSFGG